MLTDIALQRIVAHATALHERLARDTALASIQRDDITSERIARFRERAAQGNPLKFGSRLAWSGHDERSVLAALSDPEPSTLSLPPWAATVRELLCALPANTGAAPAWAGAAPVFPFEDVFYPVVEHALSRLTAPMHANVRRAIARELLGRLAKIAEQTLESVFTERRPYGHGLLARFADELCLKPDRTLYRAFVADMHGAGMASLFERFPVLARLLGTAIDFWIEAVEELFHRLEADSPDLARVFNEGEPLGEVVEMECNLSDPHNRGRTVKILTFASGVKIVYKPRDLGLEQAFGELLAWVNEHSGLLELWTPKLISRERYGWVEHVAEVACADRAAVRRFYERAGMLVGLMYALQARDLHRENLLAGGEHPVLIDLETILNADLRLGKKMEDLLGAHRQMFRSVLNSGLLPRWESAGEGEAYDMSGLGSVGDEERFGEGLAWRRLNTDEMHQVKWRIPVPVRRNSPVVGSVVARAEDHVVEVASGFEKMYRFLLARRDEILAPDGPLSGFKGRRVRMIYRDTALYMTLLDQALAPECLTSGVERGLVFEILARTFHGDAVPKGLFRVLNAEVRAMEQLDVPFFTITTDSEGFLPDGAHNVPGFFRRSGMAAATIGLQELSEGDLAQQLELLRAAFFAKVASATAGAAARGPRGSGSPALTPDALIGRAAALGEEIVSRSFGEACGVAAWMDLQLMPECGRYQLQMLGPGLYGGVSGIALFLSALHAVTGHAGSREVATRALGAARLSLLGPDVDIDWARVNAREMGIGAGEGIASLIYAHVSAARFLGDDALLDDAVLLSKLIEEEALSADLALDVLTGCAGAVLGLVALWGATGDGDVLGRAVACGNRLVATQLQAGGSAGGWLNRCGRALTGFSHGAAGNAVALLRLHAATGETAFRESALAALRFERRLFSPDHNNWPDLRGSDVPGWTFMGWCSGAPGIGLGRVAARRHLSDPALEAEIDAEIDAAVRAVSEGNRAVVDHVCCGAGGHVELLLASGREDAARLRAARWIEQADAEGGFQLFPGLPRSARSYGFFQGLSGIGYQMLRLAAPGRVPSVLLFE
jgi:type 2 lantibiotic biosynthesis protein LanM